MWRILVRQEKFIVLLKFGGSFLEIKLFSNLFCTKHFEFRGGVVYKGVF